MPRYNHAYSFGFSLISESETGEVSAQELRDAIEEALARCNDIDIMENCGEPYNSYKEG
jgi:hypothetical protein